MAQTARKALPGVLQVIAKAPSKSVNHDTATAVAGLVDKMISLSGTSPMADPERACRTSGMTNVRVRLGSIVPIGTEPGSGLLSARPDSGPGACQRWVDSRRERLAQGVGASSDLA